MPGQVAIHRRFWFESGPKVGEKCGTGRDISAFEMDVGNGVGGGATLPVELQGTVGMGPRFAVHIQFVLCEGERGEKPPVVAIGFGKRGEEGKLFLLAVLVAAEADEAVDAGCLVKHPGVGGELGDMVLHDSQGGLAVGLDAGGDRSDVRLFAACRPCAENARMLDSRPGIFHPPDKLELAGKGGVREGEPGVRLDGTLKRLDHKGAVADRPVDAVVVVRGRDIGARADGVSVSVYLPHRPSLREGRVDHRELSAAIVTAFMLVQPELAEMPEALARRGKSALGFLAQQPFDDEGRKANAGKCVLGIARMSSQFGTDGVV